MPPSKINLRFDRNDLSSQAEVLDADGELDKLFRHKNSTSIHFSLLPLIFFQIRCKETSFGCIIDFLLVLSEVYTSHCAYTRIGNVS